MKRNNRRLLAACLILTLLLSLTACGKGSDNGGQSDSPNRSARNSEAAGSDPAQGESEASGQVTENTAQNPADTAQGGQSSARSGQDADSVYNGLFSIDRVHSIDVTISQEDWDDLRANPLEKTKYKTSVTIDGETLEEVSFATKGNTSLSSVAGDQDSDRYSFKLNFGKYNKSQSYHGLNKLSLNNLYADSTYLKDWLSYRLFRQLGVDAPLVSFVWLRINGEDHGLYIAVEDVSEAWLDRTQDGEGVLYKPETEELNQMADGKGGPGGNGEGQGDFPGQGGFPGDNGQDGFPGGNGQGQGGFPGQGGQGGFPGGNGQNPGFPGQNGENGTQTPPDGVASPTPSSGTSSTTPDGSNPGTAPDGSNPGTPPEGFTPGQMPDGSTPGTPPDGFTPGQMPGGPGGMGFGGSANGADLRYTDDDTASYADIFDNDETDMDEGAAERVIAALKALSEGNAAEALDTDEVIRYFAAHNFVLNYDSYTGSMLHNYYLYERDGKLSMLPWDYNLAFGGFGGGMGGGFGEAEGGSNATSLLNTGIDTPLSGTTEENRPMWAWIPADEAYLEQYHDALEELISGYFESGVFETELDQLTELLRPYVEKDPTAFYSVEEFDQGVQTLKQFCLLRAQSIRKQLDGDLATQTDQQDSAAKVDASGLQLSTRGGMGGGNDRHRRN